MKKKPIGSTGTSTSQLLELSCIWQTSWWGKYDKDTSWKKIETKQCVKLLNGRTRAADRLRIIMWVIWLWPKDADNHPYRRKPNLAEWVRPMISWRHQNNLTHKHRSWMYRMMANELVLAVDFLDSAPTSAPCVKSIVKMVTDGGERRGIWDHELRFSLNEESPFASNTGHRQIKW